MTGMLAIGCPYPYRLDLRQRLFLAGLENINLAQSRSWNPHLLHERVSNTASSRGRGPSARTGRRKAALQRGVCERLLIMANSHEAVTESRCNALADSGVCMRGSCNALGSPRVP